MDLQIQVTRSNISILIANAHQQGWYIQEELLLLQLQQLFSFLPSPVSFILPLPLLFSFSVTSLNSIFLFVLRCTTHVFPSRAQSQDMSMHLHSVRL